MNSFIQSKKKKWGKKKWHKPRANNMNSTLTIFDLIFFSRYKKP